MIVDGHLHVFRRVNGRGANGAISSAGNGRVRDGKGLRRFLPAYFQITSLHLAAATQLLDDHGVDRAVLMQNVFIGSRNEEIYQAAKGSSGRFRGVVQVDPRSRQAARILRKYARRPEMKILKLEMSEGWGWTGIYPELRLDGPELLPLWKIAAEEGMTVIVDPGPPLNRGYQVDALASLADQFRDVPIVIEHMAYLTAEAAESGRQLAEWRRMWRLARRKNVYLGLSAAGVLLEDPYPCERMLKRLREVWKELGSEKLLWGTDAPVTLNMYTYAQMLNVLRERADFISEKDRRLIMGGNALRLWWPKK